MQKDVRNTPLYIETEELVHLLCRPGSGLICDAREINVNPEGSQAVFTGVFTDKLEGMPTTRICLADLNAGTTKVLTFGPNTDREPKFSPDGQSVVFLSDRKKTGDFQLYHLDIKTGASTPAPAVSGWIEYLHWSPDGTQVLLGVAGHGADVSGGQGAETSLKEEDAMPSWLPDVDTGDASYHWRSAWVYDLKAKNVKQVSASGLNIWEANWCGANALAAVISPSPSEGDWYTARLYVMDLDGDNDQVIYTPDDQLGWPSASPCGHRVAVVEAVCSDRWVVAGDLLIIDTDTKQLDRIHTNSVDITHTEWCSDERLFLAGHRGFEMVVMEYNAKTGKLTEGWSSQEISTGGRYIKPAPLGKGIGECLLIGENFLRAPEIGMINNGEYRTILSFDHGAESEINQWIGSVDRLTWSAPDGLEIQGLLIRPKGEGPYPVVLNVHGGPVWQWRPIWWRVNSYLPALMLLKRGYAIFQPNPRGSTGRGQAFARQVKGDMAGADTYDYLSGLDTLVEQGIADPKRLGVTGGSYGGFMTSWLITQDSRFAAAVPASPVTNHVTQHLISNIPQFQSLFMADTYTNLGGKYFERSPILHAYKVNTPTLNICGALDRCTPPEEAMQFHKALLENDIKSVLVTYPEEGHGVRRLPAAIDLIVRVVTWFEENIPAKSLQEKV